MNIIRYLSFEINNKCPHAQSHVKCPIGHPERYKFSSSHTPINTEDVMRVWTWARTKGFRGIVLWHMYNEPVLVLPIVRELMARMKDIDPLQPFQLTTSISRRVPGFDILAFSDYANGAELDDRIFTNTGEGKPYAEMPKTGRCGRGLGWEVIIDYYGNWCFCCNDWRCEEAVGNIHRTSLDALYANWSVQRKTINWENEDDYLALPRMCRACLDKNPDLHKKGGV